jgi:hypothetical protein
MPGRYRSRAGPESLRKHGEIWSLGEDSDRWPLSIEGAASERT